MTKENPIGVIIIHLGFIGYSIDILVRKDKVKEYKGRPEIILGDLSQIEVRKITNV